jgi:hypothetical protein
MPDAPYGYILIISDEERLELQYSIAQQIDYFFTVLFSGSDEE